MSKTCGCARLGPTRPRLVRTGRSPWTLRLRPRDRFCRRGHDLYGTPKNGGRVARSSTDGVCVQNRAPSWEPLTSSADFMLGALDEFLRSPQATGRRETGPGARTGHPGFPGVHQIWTARSIEREPQRCPRRRHVPVTEAQAIRPVLAGRFEHARHDCAPQSRPWTRAPRSKGDSSGDANMPVEVQEHCTRHTAACIHVKSHAGPRPSRARWPIAILLRPACGQSSCLAGTESGPSCRS